VAVGAGAAVAAEVGQLPIEEGMGAARDRIAGRPAAIERTAGGGLDLYFLCRGKSRLPCDDGYGGENHE
jgi:hypothetical protein